MTAAKSTSWVTNLASEAANRTSSWTSSKRAFAEKVLNSSRLDSNRNSQPKMDPHLQPSWPRQDRT